MKKEVNNFLDELKTYFETTSKEQQLADWAKSEECDNIGVTVSEFIENQKVMETKKDSNYFLNEISLLEHDVTKSITDVLDFKGIIEVELTLAIDYKHGDYYIQKLKSDGLIEVLYLSVDEISQISLINLELNDLINLLQMVENQCYRILQEVH